MILKSKMFIFHPPSISIEKRRFSVFTLNWKAKLAESVRIRQQEAFTNNLWIIHSDSEYGLLVAIQITDSYMLNVTDNEPFVSQNRVGMGGIVW